MRIAACQTPELLGDVEAALTCIENFSRRQEADLLLFPECFLQGYLPTAPHLRASALNLKGPEFARILRRLGRVRQTVVLGMIEARGSRYFNTAVVIAGGDLLGSYRKNNLMPGESLFEAGERYPVLDLYGVRVGINICSDTQNPEGAAAVAAQGARLLLVPAQNMMRRASAEHWKDRHNEIRRHRVRETGLWLVSADVTGTREDRIGYGPSCVINPSGDIVAQVPLMTVGAAVAEIS